MAIITCWINVFVFLFVFAIFEATSIYINLEYSYIYCNRLLINE